MPVRAGRKHPWIDYATPAGVQATIGRSGSGDGVGVMPAGSTPGPNPARGRQVGASGRPPPNDGTWAWRPKAEDRSAISRDRLERPGPPPGLSGTRHKMQWRHLYNNSSLTCPDKADRLTTPLAETSGDPQRTPLRGRAWLVVGAGRYSLHRRDLPKGYD